jgi:hypothetical protein
MAYRDDREALEGHKAELEAKLAALRATLAASKGLEASALETVRELEETYARLNAAKQKAGEGATRRALPMLERVYIASPCSVPWESMSGDERARLCASCNKTVYDVSAMTRDEAESLLTAKGTDACLRIFRRFDGTVITADCPVGVEKKKRARRRGAIAGALAATAAATAGFALTQRSATSAAPTAHARTTPTPDGLQMPPGAIAITPEPPPETDSLRGVPVSGGVGAIAVEPPRRTRPSQPTRFPRARGR